MNETSRRDLLKAAGSALVLGACSEGGEGAGGDGAAAVASSTVPAEPGSIHDVEHVVILMQENRSFDHYFGARPGVRGFADPSVETAADGRPLWYQPTTRHPDGFLLPFPIRPRETRGACMGDPLHGWIPQHTYWAGGDQTGFATFANVNMTYFDHGDLPYYDALASAFTLCDNSFCSVIGPTTPNRLYAFTGGIDAQGAAGGPVIENLEGPFHWETYPERLEAAGISWRVYHEEDDFDDNPLKWFAQYQGLSESHPLHEGAIRNRASDAFEQDVAGGDLPQVSWIVAPAALCEHPALGAPYPGIDYAARKLGALLAKPEVWAKTVFLLTYDENGGFFDHVRPPVAPKGTPGEWAGDSPIGLGFRVTTIVASPWSRGGKVSSTVFDHTSILRLLETRFGVEAPNVSAWRRETCGDLAEVLDFTTADVSVPELPDTSAGAADALECGTLPPLTVPHPQVPPGTH